MNAQGLLSVDLDEGTESSEVVGGTDSIGNDALTYKRDGFRSEYTRAVGIAKVSCNTGHAFDAREQELPRLAKLVNGRGKIASNDQGKKDAFVVSVDRFAKVEGLQNASRGEPQGTVDDESANRSEGFRNDWREDNTAGDVNNAMTALPVIEADFAVGADHEFGSRSIGNWRIGGDDAIDG